MLQAERRIERPSSVESHLSGETPNLGGREGFGVEKISVRKVVASMLAGLALAITVGPAFGDAGGGPGSNSGCPGHQPPPPPSAGCGH
jgi:hypothetical protein